MTFQEQIETYLEPLPSEWKEKLTLLLCGIRDSIIKPECTDFKECETITSLSDFTVEDGVVSIQYKDEESVTVTRSFSFEEVVNSQLDGLDPNCLTDDTTWSNMSYTERLQLLIDSHCDCCEA